MASMLQGLIAKMKQPDPEEERIRKRADEGIAQHEQETGEKFQPEPGIEEDYTIEDTASILVGGPAAGMARRAATAGARKAGGVAVEKLKQKGAPPPRFDEAVAGGRESGGKSFAEFIRSEKAPAQGPAKQKPEVLNQPRFGTNDRVRELQAERQGLDLKSPQGRDRLKEIDRLLENRTYFRE